MFFTINICVILTLLGSCFDCANFVWYLRRSIIYIFNYFGFHFLGNKRLSARESCKSSCCISSNFISFIRPGVEVGVIV